MSKKGNNDATIALGLNDNNVIIKEDSRYMGTLIVGPTGSGKTYGVLAPMVKQDIENKVGGVTIFDKTGDLSKTAYVYARSNRRKVTYLNPLVTNVKYNPMKGNEDIVIDNFIIAFKSIKQELPKFLQDMNELLIRNAIKIVKRLKGDNATLIDLSNLIYNSQGQGKIMINQFTRLKTDTVEMAKENETIKENGELASWFLFDYYCEKSRTYENTNAFRMFLGNFLSDKNIKNIFNIDNEGNKDNEIDFQRCIKNKEVVIIDLSFLNSKDFNIFLETLLFTNYKSIVCQNKGNNYPNFIYFDNHSYCYPLISELIMYGRLYKIGLTISVQSISQLEDSYSLIFSYMRNLILMPGMNMQDVLFFNNNFISEYSFDKMFYRNFGEIVYSLIDNDAKGCHNIGIGRVYFLSKKEEDFIQKRMSQYIKQLKKVF